MYIWRILGLYALGALAISLVLLPGVVIFVHFFSPIFDLDWMILKMPLFGAAVLGSLMITGLGSALAWVLAELVFYGKERFQWPLLQRGLQPIYWVWDAIPPLALGCFVYFLMVLVGGRFSGLAGIIAVMLLTFPKWLQFCELGKQGEYEHGYLDILQMLLRVMGDASLLLVTILGIHFISIDILKPMHAIPLLMYQATLKSNMGGLLNVLVLLFLLLSLIVSLIRVRKGRYRGS